MNARSSGLANPVLSSGRAHKLSAVSAIGPMGVVRIMLQASAFSVSQHEDEASLHIASFPIQPVGGS